MYRVRLVDAGLGWVISDFGHFRPSSAQAKSWLHCYAASKDKGTSGTLKMKLINPGPRPPGSPCMDVRSATYGNVENIWVIVVVRSQIKFRQEESRISFHILRTTSRRTTGASPHTTVRTFCIEWKNHRSTASGVTRQGHTIFPWEKWLRVRALLYPKGAHFLSGSPDKILEKPSDGYIPDSAMPSSSS